MPGPGSMTSLSFKIDPVPWARPRKSRSGGFFTAKPQAAFKAQIQTLMRLSWKGAPLDGAIGLSITFTIRRPKSVKRLFPNVKPDLDNLEKTVLDAGNKILWHDDAMIVDVSKAKRYGDTGRIELIIVHMEGDDHGKGRSRGKG